MNFIQEPQTNRPNLQFNQAFAQGPHVLASTTSQQQQQHRST